MKFLYLPLLAPGGASEQKDFIETLRKKIGVNNVVVFDYMAFKGDPSIELIRLAQKHKPDIIHMQLQENQQIKPAAIARVKRNNPRVVISQWSGDVRPNPIRPMVLVGQLIDYTLISSSGQIQMYENQIGAGKVKYWQIGVAERFLTKPLPRGKRWGIGFCGNNYQSRFPQSEERKNLVNLMRRSFREKFRLHGMNWENATPQPWSEQPNFYRTCIATVSHNHIVTAHYASDRTWIALAAGVPHICHWAPGMEDYFRDGIDCLYWRTPQMAVKHAKWCIQNPVEAERIGLNGQKKIRDHHTWNSRIDELEKILKVKFQ